MLRVRGRDAVLRSLRQGRQHFVGFIVALMGISLELWHMRSSSECKVFQIIDALNQQRSRYLRF